jgi:hypothetical protein
MKILGNELWKLQLAGIIATLWFYSMKFQLFKE